MIRHDIKLILTDLDGTYISRRSISKENKRAVELAQAKGVRVMACTGRCWAMCDELIPTLGFDEYVVTSNGASVIHVKSGKTVFSKQIAPQWLSALFEAAWAGKDPFDVYCGPFIHTYMPLRSKWTIGCEEYTKTHPDEQNIKFRHFPDYTSWFEATKGRAELFRVEVEPGMPFPQALRQVAEEFGLGDPTVSFQDHYDLCHPDATKANAVEFLCKKLRIARENVMVLGDGGNDVDMIRFAGIGVAMGNGTKQAKAAADIVAPACEENGFAWAVYRFVSGNG